jgi:hypothetical protein
VSIKEYCHYCNQLTNTPYYRIPGGLVCEECFNEMPRARVRDAWKIEKIEPQEPSTANLTQELADLTAEYERLRLACVNLLEGWDRFLYGGEKKVIYNLKLIQKILEERK